MNAAILCLGLIVSVVDGDTLAHRCDDGRELRVRLPDVSAPEVRGCERSLGVAVAADLRGMVEGARAALHRPRSWSYGRAVADLTLEATGESVRALAIYAGAEPYDHEGGEPAPRWC